MRSPFHRLLELCDLACFWVAIALCVEMMEIMIAFV
jgi:hypothetical protein